ncbi:hypothetical protein H632_c125p1 [Helicosporidium sp. ATCC 50920]|nr:hypothetical protein H632_c125p1 [Helicosporidium sp. ATCC 50920]|eukprot:KDD76728.1 hypothetical protein H632_c125p1 [Helicosporidium sp. ATCC 50920]
MLRALTARAPAFVSVARPLNGIGVEVRHNSTFGKLTASDEAEIEKAEARVGAKTVITRLLHDNQGELLTSDQLWQLAEPEGIKSKRFMKMMLQELKSRGRVHTRPVQSAKRTKKFGYKIAEPKVLKAEASAEAV